MKLVIVCGSERDKPFVKPFVEAFPEAELHFASAHKQPLKVLDIIKSNQDEPKVVFLTIAGRSNALSGFVAANSVHVVIACPPFVDKVDMMTNINSTLQMPSDVPVLTILDRYNCIEALRRLETFSK